MLEVQTISSSVLRTVLCHVLHEPDVDWKKDVGISNQTDDFVRVEVKMQSRQQNLCSF